MNINTLLTVDQVYLVVGIYLFIFTILTLLDKQHKAKWGMAVFWGLYGLVFVAGPQLHPAFIGLIVLVLAVIAALNWMGLGNYNAALADFRLKMSDKYKLWLFAPALTIPIVTFLIAFLMPKWGALVGLGVGAVLGLLFAWALLRANIVQGFNEGRRLIDSISWAVILPQFLAALGFLFDKAGVGQVVSQMVSSVIPTDNRFAVVIAYCVGMMLFTMIMGNAFAAFAVMTTGIGIPLVMKLHGGDAAIAGTIAMLAGYCGTLMTPMAANFNIVPAALLEMQDKNGVMKAQVLTAIPVLIINILLMYFLAFPGK
jgi:uncharacterized membrane protein